MLVKRNKCKHVWYHVGDVWVETGTAMFPESEERVVLYCPKCEAEQKLEREEATVELNKIRIREEFHNEQRGND